jgi:hypothetical protein
LTPHSGELVGGSSAANTTSSELEVVGAAEQHHAVRPGRVDQAAAALLALSHQSLPDPGHHQVRQLNQMERVDTDFGIR